MKQRNLQSMNREDRELIEKALDATAHAYAPYSGFAVGAAVRTQSGKVYTGSNLENASFGVTMCAEVAALTAANTAGDFNVEAIAIVGHKFTEPRDATMVTTPCGRCRQLISEAGQIRKVDVRVFSCNGNLDEIHESKISELLPEAFGPANLDMDIKWSQMLPALEEVVEALKHSVYA
jgi:cytidine deaminase